LVPLSLPCYRLQCGLTCEIRALPRKKAKSAPSAAAAVDAEALQQQLSAIGDANASAISKQLLERVNALGKLLPPPPPPPQPQPSAAEAKGKKGSSVKDEPPASQASNANQDKSPGKRKRNDPKPAEEVEPSKTPARAAASTAATAIASSSKKPRNKWTKDEEDNLRIGVARYGHGSWAKILENFQFNARSAVDLKDKWRNMNK
jgi:hypothetical protein